MTCLLARCGDTCLLKVARSGMSLFKRMLGCSKHENRRTLWLRMGMTPSNSSSNMPLKTASTRPCPPRMSSSSRSSADWLLASAASAATAVALLGVPPTGTGSGRMKACCTA